MSTAIPSRPAAPRASAPVKRTEKPSLLASTIDPIRVLRRHVLTIIAAAILGGFLGTAAFLALREFYPLYSGQVLFEVKPGLQEAGKVSSTDITNDDMVFRIAQTETYLLSSQAVLRKALQHPDVKQTNWFRSFVKVQSDGAEAPNFEEALEDLEEEIGTTVVRSSNLFSLTWAAHNQADVPIVLNAIESAYMTSRRERDTVVYDQNLGVFNDQLDKTARELQDIAAEIKDLIRASGMNTLDDTRWSAQMFRMQELTRTHAEAVTTYNIITTSLNLVQDQLRGAVEPSPADVLDAERDPTMEATMQGLQALKTHRHNLLATRNPDSPMVRDNEQLIQSAEAQRDTQIKQLINRNLEARARQLEEQKERFTNSIKNLEEEIDTVNAELQDLAAQQSEYEALKLRQEHLEAKRQSDLELIGEVQLMRLRADAARVSVAQRAYTPREPSFPKPEIVIPLAILLLVGLTVGAVFLRELTDQRVKSASDVAVLPGAHVLGSIPDAAEDPTKTATPELVVRRQPLSVLAESYRQAATALWPLMDNAGHQTLLLVGGMPGSGTTTVATNLAAAAAASGKSVLLVDANFRRPRLAQAMGVEGDGPGLGDVLCGSATIDQALNDAGDGVSVMPAGTTANRVFERLNNGSIDAALNELRSRFDYVILDAPPAIVAGDAMVLANRVDAAVLIVRAHQEHRGLVARMINRLSDSRCELLGVLLNRPRGIAGGYLKKNYATMAKYAANSSPR